MNFAFFKRIDLGLILLLVIIQTIYVACAFMEVIAIYEGTHKENFFVPLLADSFFFFLYPTKFFTGEGYFIWNFTVGILINMIFYGFLIERIAYFLFVRK